MNRSLLSVFCALLMLVGLPSILAQESSWPRTLPLEQGTVTIYSLQVDEMSDDIIHFRAALAYRATAGSEPVFGAGWFESRVEIDSSSRIVHPIDLKVTQTRFPDGTDDVHSELSAVLAQQSPDWSLDFSVDELEAALKQAEAESMAAQNLNTAPPRIIYRDHPALLISIDGEPVLREIENSPYKAVINTPYPLIFDGGRYYLNAAKGVWYRADKVTGPYQFEASPPADIAAMVNAAKEADAADAAAEQPAVLITATNAPEIVVSVEPAQLIVTEGPAAFVPLVDDLLVLQNSDDDVFMHVSSQKFYIVLAGRWYHAGSLNGPWTYQPADDLPSAFANIPRDSNQADSRVYVAGTEEARDAVLDAQVPQTAAVARGEADIEVEYDGDPIYQPVDGTDLVYIQNTGSAVLQSDGLYYLVEDGVWYVSASPNGPWQVSTQRPAQVDTILPTSPVYNVKYVHVYDSTPSVVYVGYTPGYYGSYVYHNTIFYGSGWYYQPWVSPYYYYPRYSSWGWNVSYNPWSGWNFGLSWGWGPFGVSYYSGGYWHQNHYWHHRHYGRWGPGHYRPRHNGHRGNRGNRGNRRDRYADNDHGRNDGRSRIEPVRPSALRQKANIRDANHAARQTLLLADSSGNVYRKADRGPDRRTDRGTDRRPDRSDADKRSSKPAKGAKHRTMPVAPPTSERNAGRTSSKPAKGAKHRTMPVVPPTGERNAGRNRDRVNNEKGRKRSVQTTTITSARPAQIRASDREPGQNGSRPGPQPQSSQKSGRNNSAPVQRAPQRSAQKVNGQRHRSNGGKRARVSRPKKL